MAAKPNTRQVPSVGRIVHVRIEDQCVAAIVLAVGLAGNPESPLALWVLSLNVASTGGFYLDNHATYGDGHGQWHWPEFVPPVES